MKKSLALVSIFIIIPGLFAAAPGENRYENYIVIKYLINERNFAKAGDYIENHLKNYPDDPFVLTEKAFILYEIKNDRQGAVKLLEKAGETYPEYYYSNYLQAWILFSEYSGNRKNKTLLEKAAACLETSIKDNPGYYNSCFLLGVILSATGNYKESNKYFEISNRLQETPETYYNMSGNYNKMGDSAGEIAAYKKILEFDPGNLYIIDMLSQVYLEKKDYKNALAYLETLFSLNPQDKSISFRYLFALFAVGRNKRFLEISDNIDISSSPLLTYARAFILCTKQRYSEAEKLLLGPNREDIQSRMLLADIYYRKRDYRQAYLILEQIDKKYRDNIYYSLQLEILSGLNLNRKIIALYSRIENNNPVLEKFTLEDYYNIILAFCNLNETQKAYRAALAFRLRLKNDSAELSELIRFFESFLRPAAIAAEEIEFIPNLFIISGLYKNQGKFDQAASLIKKSIEKSEEPFYFVELCDIYQQQGKYKEMEKLLKWSIKKYPDDLLAKNFYAYYLAMQNKELEFALALSAATLEKDGENPAYLDTYGYILLASGRAAESIQYLKKAYDKHPLEPDIMEHLACYYRREKDFDSIIEIYRKAVEYGVDFADRLIKEMRLMKTLKE
ncbi:MAG: tetratricopeptide repeat protein [Candidatus Aminicenantes bacterium]|nr:tetratricopeptide repeat protein [Candidatus Aminicenantes bacterium]